jgi:hypothetical protein
MLLTSETGWQIHTNEGVDCSIGVDFARDTRADQPRLGCFDMPFPSFVPLYCRKKGAPVNCDRLSFNPHSSGTHTEWIGHVSVCRSNIF